MFKGQIIKEEEYEYNGRTEHDKQTHKVNYKVALVLKNRP